MFSTWASATSSSGHNVLSEPRPPPRSLNEYLYCSFIIPSSLALTLYRIGSSSTTDVEQSLLFGRHLRFPPCSLASNVLHVVPFSEGYWSRDEFALMRTCILIFIPLNRVSCDIEFLTTSHTSNCLPPLFHRYKSFSEKSPTIAQKVIVLSSATLRRIQRHT